MGFRDFAPKAFTGFTPNIFFGGRPPKFDTAKVYVPTLPIMCESFRAIASAISEIWRRKVPQKKKEKKNNAKT